MLASVLTDKTSPKGWAPILGSSISDLVSLSLSSPCELAEWRRRGAKMGVDGTEDVKDEADDDEE